MCSFSIRYHFRQITWQNLSSPWTKGMSGQSRSGNLWTTWGETKCKHANFRVLNGQELNVLLYLATTLSSPWSAFSVVIPTYHKVVHKARGRGVGHDWTVNFPQGIICLLAWPARAPSHSLAASPTSSQLPHDTAGPSRSPSLPHQTLSPSSSSQFCLIFPISSITNHIYVCRHLTHPLVFRYITYFSNQPENMSEMLLLDEIAQNTKKLGRCNCTHPWESNVQERWPISIYTIKVEGKRQNLFNIFSNWLFQFQDTFLDTSLTWVGHMPSNREVTWLELEDDHLTVPLLLNNKRMQRVTTLTLTVHILSRNSNLVNILWSLTILEPSHF